MKFTLLEEKRPVYDDNCLLIISYSDNSGFYLGYGSLGKTDSCGHWFYVDGEDGTTNQVVAWANVKIPKEFS